MMNRTQPQWVSGCKQRSAFRREALEEIREALMERNGFHFEGQHDD